MEDMLLISRIQFAFTITFHYLFPQLTMGLALLIVILKGFALKTKNEHYNEAAKFWGKIFAISFAMGVVTGIPMEFQFGTNWAKFSAFAGGVIGQTLALEGMFAFFLESTFLGIFLWGEKRFGQTVHFISILMVCIGAWLSGYFIVATNAWMQHPVAYSIAADGNVHITDFFGLLFNPWILWQYSHTMLGSVATGSFVMAAVGAYYLLAKRDIEFGKTFVRFGMIAAAIASLLLVVPTGDAQVKAVYKHKPLQFSAMEGVFETKEGAEFILFGTPNTQTMQIENKVAVPYLLSLMTHFDPKGKIAGLKEFPKELWPTSISLLFYSYRVMILLGVLFVTITVLALYFLWRKTLFEQRWLLWIIMFSFPLPYMANTAGWMTAEVGRQPWLVYGLLLTRDGVSPLVPEGTSLFTLLGFITLYFVFGLLYLILVLKKIHQGPEAEQRKA